MKRLSMPYLESLKDLFFNVNKMFITNPSPDFVLDEDDCQIIFYSSFLSEKGKKEIRSHLDTLS